MSSQTPATPRPRRERTENAARRRRQMIDATLRSVARHGLASTTLATVSREAGLSQGVVVFYFTTKERLLAEALRAHYQVYKATWEAALAAAGPDPAQRLAALVGADFDEAVFNPEAMAVWHGYWGQASARPAYVEIAEEFDRPRAAALTELCAGLERADGAPPEITAGAIDTMTDGLWLRAYLAATWPERREITDILALGLKALLPQDGAAIATAIGENRA